MNQTTEPPPGSPPGAPVDDSRGRLRKSATDKTIAGVCGGLGRYFGVDPVVFRIAFVALALAGGSGVLLYIVAALVLPKDDGTCGVVAPTADQRMVVGAVLAGAAFLLVGDDVFDGGFDIGGLMTLLSIGAVGWYLFRPGGPLRHEYGRGRTGPATPTEPTEPWVAPGPDTTTSAPWTAWEPLGGTTPPPPAAPPKPAREKKSRVPVSPVGRYVASLVLIAAGAVALLDETDVLDVDLDPRTLLAGGLVVVGFGLLVGARWGRSPGLVALGVLLTMGMVAVDSGQDVGNSTNVRWIPRHADGFRQEYVWAAGDALLDLSHADIPDGDYDIEANVGAGNLTVLLPPDVDVEVYADAGVGELKVLGRRSDGVGPAIQVVDKGVRGDIGADPVLRLNLFVGAGELEVRRAAA